MVSVFCLSKHGHSFDRRVPRCEYVYRYASVDISDKPVPAYDVDCGLVRDKRHKAFAGSLESYSCDYDPYDEYDHKGDHTIHRVL
jgi:hypothetical protein